MRHHGYETFYVPLSAKECQAQEIFNGKSNSEIFLLRFSNDSNCMGDANGWWQSCCQCYWKFDVVSDSTFLLLWNNKFKTKFTYWTQLKYEILRSTSKPQCVCNFKVDFRCRTAKMTENLQAANNLLAKISCLIYDRII